jgi:hypothetical protein
MVNDSGYRAIIRTGNIPPNVIRPVNGGGFIGHIELPPFGQEPIADDPAPS